MFGSCKRVCNKLIYSIYSNSLLLCFLLFSAVLEEQKNEKNDILFETFVISEYL